MANPMSQLDHAQVIKSSYNDDIGALKVLNGWLYAAVGNEIDISSIDSTHDLVQLKNGSVVSIELTLTYTDTTKLAISVAKRTA